MMEVGKAVPIAVERAARGRVPFKMGTITKLLDNDRAEVLVDGKVHTHWLVHLKHWATLAKRDWGMRSKWI